MKRLAFRKSRVKTPTTPHRDVRERISSFYIAPGGLRVAHDAVFEQRGGPSAYRAGDAVKAIQGQVFHR